MNGKSVQQNRVHVAAKEEWDAETSIIFSALARLFVSKVECPREGTVLRGAGER